MFAPIRAVFATLALCLFATTAPAQELAEFKSHSALEQAVAQKMAERDFGGVLDVLDPAGRFIPEVKRQQLVKGFGDYFKSGLTNSATLYDEEIGGGFRRTIYAYWGTGNPAYLYVVAQKRGDRVHMLQFDLQGTFSKVHANW